MIAKLVHTPIGGLVTKVSTWDPTRAPTNDVFRYIDISSVDQETKAVRDVQQIRTHEAPSRARQLVRQNDVLASTVRPNLNAVAIVPNELDGATASTGFCILRAKPDLLFPPYLFYWVRSPAFIRDMSSRATGASYPAVTDGIIRDSRIPLLPLPEQKRIAGILDKADALRRKRQQALQLTEQFLRSTFLDMFGDIPAKRSAYSFGPVRPYVSAQSGKSSKLVLSDRPTGIPIFGGNGINGWATKPLFDESVIVVGRVGQQCGIIHVTECPAWVTDNAIVLQVIDRARINPVYLATALQHSPIRDAVTHLDLPFVNQSMVLDYPIPLPPIERQDEYGNLRARFLQTQQVLHRTAEVSEALFSSLVQRAFRGEL